MDKTKIWNSLKTPPKTALKIIAAGRLKGKSDISPQWRYQALTEQFGPCGTGWKYTIDKLWPEPGHGGEIFAFANISFYWSAGEGWSDPIPATGGSVLIQSEKNGMHNNDEAYKMAVTDALGTAMKMIGVAADVYLGMCDTKYNQPDRTASPAAQHGTQESAGGEYKISGVLAGFTEKSGTASNGRAWTLYTAELQDGTKASTFDGAQADAISASIGATVELVCKKTAKGGNNIVSMAIQSTPADAKPQDPNNELPF